MLTPEPAHVELDADLEQQQHDADIGQQLHLLAIGLAGFGEQLEGHQADHQVTDHRRQAKPPRDEPEHGSGQEQRAQLEDREGGRFHGCSLAFAQVRRRRVLGDAAAT